MKNLRKEHHWPKIRMLVDMKNIANCYQKTTKRCLMSPFFLWELNTEKGVQTEIATGSKPEGQIHTSKHMQCTIISHNLLWRRGVLQLSNQSAVFKTVMLSPENREQHRGSLSECLLSVRQSSVALMLLLLSGPLAKITTAWHILHFSFLSGLFNSVKYIYNND